MSLARQHRATLSAQIRREGTLYRWMRLELIPNGLEQDIGESIPVEAHAYITRERSEVEGVASGAQVYRVDRIPFGDLDVEVRDAEPLTVVIDGEERPIQAWIVRPTHVIAHIRTGGAGNG